MNRIYLIKRIFLIIPTLLVISILVFLLSQLNIQDQLILKADHFKTEKSDPSTFFIQSNFSEAQLNLNLPPFYFSIYRKSSSDTLYKVKNEKVKHRLEELSIQTGDWISINNFFSTFKRTIRNSELSNSDKKILLNTFLYGSLKTTKAKIRAHKELVELNIATESLTKTSNSINNYLPAISFNGNNNRYHMWIANIINGNFGYSSSNNQQVSERIKSSIGWTLLLSSLSISLALLFAFPSAIYAAIKPNSVLTKFFTNLFYAFYSIPNFWMATMLIVFLASGQYLNLFPAYGYGQPLNGNAPILRVIFERLTHLALPVFCLSYGILAYFFQQIKSAIESELKKGYVITAYAKGMKTKDIIKYQVLKNASFPLITILGKIFPALISGSFVIEYIFAIPGMGKLSVEALFARDYSVLYTILLLTAFLTSIGLLVADLCYYWLDPRMNKTSKAKSH